jgi:twitching motility protein PilT
VTKLIRDPQLDELVKELNESSAESAEEEPAAPPAPSWPPALIPSGNPIEDLLTDMARRGASDLLLLAGAKPIFRVDGRLVASDHAALSLDDIHGLLGAFLTARVQARIEEDGSADFSVRLARQISEDDRGAWRFRINIHRQRGTLAAAIRSLPDTIPTLAELHLPATLAELVKPTRGLVLVCGPTGSGK